MVLLVTLFSLVLGELVPERLALGHADSISLMVAKLIKWFSILCSPALRVLSFITEGILRILWYKTPEDAAVTEPEVRMKV